MNDQAAESNPSLCTVWRSRKRHYTYLYLQEDQQGQSEGFWEFDTDQFFDYRGGDVLPNLVNPILFEAEFPFWVERQHHWYQQFYIQDEWRPLSNLTLNLGFRYEN